MVWSCIVAAGGWATGLIGVAGRGALVAVLVLVGVVIVPVAPTYLSSAAFNEQHSALPARAARPCITRALSTGKDRCPLCLEPCTKRQLSEECSHLVDMISTVKALQAAVAECVLLGCWRLPGRHIVVVARD